MNGPTITPNPSLPLWPRPLTPLNGIPILTEPNLTVTRIKPRPKHSNRRQIWRKWQATKIVTEPNPHIYRFGPYIVGHPETIAKLATAIDMMNNGTGPNVTLQLETMP